ncbi:MAG: hypothetical protein C4555_06325 [Dehalococcoidia bacterium]|nr:MAG: hypothetical protein C4555_06325 [Dehalococcoidia bacterium]
MRLVSARLVLVVLLLARFAYGAIAEVGTSGANHNGVGGTSTTLSFTVGAGANFLVCGLAKRSTSDASGVTFNSVAMSFLQEQAGTGGATLGVEIWYLANPNITTADVVASHGSIRAVLGCMALSGVNTGSPFGTVVAGGGNTQDATVSVSSTASGLVFAVVSRRNSDLAMAPGTDTTEEWEVAGTDATTDNNCIGWGGSEVGTGGNVTINATWTTSNRQWEMLGVNINAAGSRNRVRVVTVQ